MIDADRCVGHGRCYALAPDLVEPDDFGHGLVVEQPSEADLDVVEDAVQACPERAVTFEPRL